MSFKNYSVSSHCRYVKGAHQSAIYDLLNNEVFSINAQGTVILDKALNQKELSTEDYIFLDDLVNAKLLNDHTHPIEDLKLPPTFNYVWLEITNGCNCECLHCYGAFGLPKKCEIAKELKIDEWKRIIDDIYRMGCRSVQFIGGEPLVAPFFEEIVEYAKKIGIERIDVFTNGTLIKEHTAQILKEVGANVRVSIYGYDSETHDYITKRPGSFIKLDHSINMLQKYGVPVSPAIVLMEENQSYLTGIIEYLKSKNLEYHGFDTVRKVRHSPQKSHCVTDQEVLNKRLMLMPRFTTSLYDYCCSLNWNNCWFGKMSIAANGEVIPCIFARDLSCGNVRNDSWDDIKKSLIEKWKITKDHVLVCKDCEYRYACDDCRPLALGETGELLNKYPRCLYDPHTGKWEQPIKKED